MRCKIQHVPALAACNAGRSYTIVITAACIQPWGSYREGGTEEATIPPPCIAPLGPAFVQKLSETL